MRRRHYTIVLALLVSGIMKAQKSFEFVVLPDTQTYVEEFPEVYFKQMEWIEKNKDRFSFVLHVGDITQNNSKEEWTTARKGFAILDGKVPYHLALGNHDMGSGPGKFADNRNTEFANEYFPYNAYKQQSNTIASFPKETIDNTCANYNLIGQNWLIFSLEFGPRNKTIQWVDSIIKKHPKHKVIINTHAYMYDDNTLQDGDDWYLPQKYGVGKSEGEDAVNDGGQLWEKLVKTNKNIIMVFSGHILGTGVGQLVSENVFGQNVYQMLANYQKNVKGVEKGDSGYLRIIKVDKKLQTISVKTYSPWLDQFKKEPDHEFTFENIKL